MPERGSARLLSRDSRAALRGQPRLVAIERRAAGHRRGGTFRFPYDQWRVVTAAEGEDVAQPWFIGSDTWLRQDTRVDAIREGRFDEVEAAASALVSDAFAD
jgi:hypothetical protein